MGMLNTMMLLQNRSNKLTKKREYTENKVKWSGEEKVKMGMLNTMMLLQNRSNKLSKKRQYTEKKVKWSGEEKVKTI